MKSLLGYSATTAMALSFMIATPVSAQSGNDARESVLTCKEFTEGGRGFNQGACISYDRAPDPVNFCKILRDFGALETFGYRTQGECIKAQSEAMSSSPGL